MAEIVGTAYVNIRALTNQLSSDIERGMEEAGSSSSLADSSDALGAYMGDSIGMAAGDETALAFEDTAGAGMFDAGDRIGADTGTQMGYSMADSFDATAGPLLGDSADAIGADVGTRLGDSTSRNFEDTASVQVVHAAHRVGDDAGSELARAMHTAFEDDSNGLAYTAEAIGINTGATMGDGLERGLVRHGPAVAAATSAIGAQAGDALTESLRKSVASGKRPDWLDLPFFDAEKEIAKIAKASGTFDDAVYQAHLAFYRAETQADDAFARANRSLRGLIESRADLITGDLIDPAQTEAVVSAFEDLGREAAEAMGASVSDSDALSEALSKGLGADVRVIGQDAGADFSDGISEGIDRGSPGVVQSGQTLADLLSHSMSEEISSGLEEGFREAGSDAADAMGEELSDTDRVLGKMHTSIVDGVDDIGRDAGDAMGAGMESGLDGHRSSIADAGAEIGEAFGAAVIDGVSHYMDGSGRPDWLDKPYAEAQKEVHKLASATGKFDEEAYKANMALWHAETNATDTMGRAARSIRIAAQTKAANLLEDALPSPAQANKFVQYFNNIGASAADAIVSGLSGVGKSIGPIALLIVGALAALGPTISGAILAAVPVAVGAMASIGLAAGGLMLAFKAGGDEVTGMKIKLLEMWDDWKKVGQDLAHTIFPPIMAFIDNMSKTYLPVFSKTLKDIAPIFQGVLDKLEDAFTKNGMPDLIKRIAEASADMGAHFGKALIDVGNAIAIVMDAARPLMEEFGQWVEGAAHDFLNMVEGSALNGNLAKWFQSVVEQAKAFGRVVGGLWKLVEPFFNPENGSPSGLEKFADQMERTAPFIEAVVDAIGLFMDGLGALVEMISRAVKPVIEVFQTGLDNLKSTLSWFAETGKAIGQFFGFIADDADAATPKIDGVTTATKNFQGAVETSARPVEAFSGYMDEMTVGANNYVTAAGTAYETTGDLAGQLQSAGGYAGTYADAVGKAATNSQTLGDGLTGTTINVGAYGTAAGDAAGQTDGLNKALRDSIDAMNESTEAWDTYGTKFDRQEDATLAVEKGWQTLDKALKDGKNSMLENKSLLRDQAAAIKASAKANEDNGMSIGEVTARYAKQRKSLIEVAKRMGMNKTEAELYVNQLLKTPKHLKTELDIKHPSKITIDLEYRVKQGQTRLPSGPFKGKVVPFASGGIVTPTAEGTLALLAEAGHKERVEPLDPNGISARDKAIIKELAKGYGGGEAKTSKHVTVNNYYPKPEPTSTSLAMSLRVAKATGEL